MATLEFRSESVHVQVLAPRSDAARHVLTSDALRMVGTVCATFEARRQALLSARKSRAAALDGGETPTFQNDPAVQDPSWKCAPIPDDVQDRRVEITGPVDRKMVINGLNSGACVYMADFEDSTSPTWTNVVEGQLNLRDAVDGSISFASGTKVYQLNAKTATLFVRPRGWHLDEGHVLVNGKPASGGIFDFCLYLFHNHQALLNKGTRPYYYLPKLESRHEARLWNDVILSAEAFLGLAVGTVRATVLLETITAAFEMEEILYELRDHMLGLNCGRWDYLFSYIKKFKLHPDKITPDRAHLTMTTPLMTAYVKRLVHLCHKRGTFAMGGMSAAIPIKNDPARNAAAMQAVEQDKLREVQLGHDGTWVAHPALVQVAKGVFDAHMVTPNQIATNPGRDGAYVTEADLLELPVISASEAVTSPALAKGVGIVLSYTEAWLRGVGCIPLHNAMEDAATAEISRAQIWSWRVHRVRTSDDGGEITAERISRLVQGMVEQRCGAAATGNKWTLAGKLVEHMLNKPELDDFLTSVCYPHILTTHEAASGGSDNVSSKL
jgi:malate synthase